MDGLPYWKFYANKWLAGNIQAHDMETQGIFINLCARAWADGGEVENNTDRLSRILRVDKQVLANAIQLLLDDCLLVETESGNLSSKYILLQLSERDTLSKKRAQAGRKGGKAKQLNRRSKCQASAKQKGSIKETETESEEEQENTPQPPKGGKYAPAVIPQELLQQQGFAHEFGEYLKTRKTKATTRAQELLLTELRKRPSDAVEALQIAILRGWTGIKWEWVDNHRGTGKPKHDNFLDVTNA